ncbi:MAG: radical SAM protein [Elusimicrobiota bacterium]
MKKIFNPPSPFHSDQRELLEPASEANLEVYEDHARSILSYNESPDLSFRWSVNPYRGCFHSCAYCYARRYHEYLDLGAGTDFETKIAIKKNAGELLRAEFLKKSWKGESILFSGATDCYQPLEAVYKLTQDCLKVCVEYKNPAVIISKSFLVTRDIELIRELHQVSFCPVVISIPFLDESTARKIEPQASAIERRFQAVEMLAKAGISVGISLAPTIPGLNENDIPKILEKASSVGASFAFHTLLRLSGSVKDVFFEKINKVLSAEKVERITKRIQETRGGKINNSEFAIRMMGQGVYWKSIHDIFRIYQEKFNLAKFPQEPIPSKFTIPQPQMEFTFLG